MVCHCNRMCTIQRGIAHQYADALSCNPVWFSLTARIEAAPRVWAHAIQFSS